MRRQIVWFLWGIASVYGLWRGVRLTFFPSGAQARGPAGPPGASASIEVIEPTYLWGGILILLLVLLIYAWLAHALFNHQYTTFRAVAAGHIVLSVLTFSIGWLFLASDIALLLAIVASLGLSADRERKINDA